MKPAEISFRAGFFMNKLIKDRVQNNIGNDSKSEAGGGDLDDEYFHHRKLKLNYKEHESLSKLLLEIGAHFLNCRKRGIKNAG